MENCRKIILVAHCLLIKGFVNSFSNDMSEVVKILSETDTGIIQMPCPHLYSLNNKKAGQSNSDIDKKQFSLSFIEKVKKSNPESLYEGMINPLLAQLKKYQQHEFEIVGIIGVKNSPVCGVNNQKTNKLVSSNYGSFINFVNNKLKTQKIKLRMADIDIPN